MVFTVYLIAFNYTVQQNFLHWAEMCDFEDFCALNLQKVLKVAKSSKKGHFREPHALIGESSNFWFTLKVGYI